MIVPFLPPELISEIISHLEDEDHVDEQTRDGKAVSLVCKSWRRLGQALRWKMVSTNPDQSLSLTDHFTQHPQLPALVKTCKLTHENQTVDCSALLYNSSIALIPMMADLRVMAVLGGKRLNYRELLKVSSKLPHLEQFELLLHGGHGWTSEANLILRSGFKKLRIFGLSISGFMIRESPGRDSIGPPISLTQLVLSNEFPFDGSPILGLRDGYFSNFEPKTLRKAALGHSALNSESLTWLSCCPLLQSLEVGLRDPLVQLKFPEIILFLPRFPALEDFRCRIIVSRTTDSEKVNSPVSLTTVLNSFPPTLRLFEAKELIFSDHDALSQRPPPTTRTENVYSFSALRFDDEEEGKFIPLSIWGEKVMGGLGRIEWYRAPGEVVDVCEY
ncbi:hypothetical protein JCM5350_000042 [Sporobolomyces pararoseus]